MNGRLARPGSEALTRALLGAAMAGAYLSAGSLVEAERDARSAIGFLETTDFLTVHADSGLILGDVLRATGRRPEADAAFRGALDLYGQKGSLVGVKVAEARLASWPRIAPGIE